MAAQIPMMIEYVNFMKKSRSIDLKFYYLKKPIKQIFNLFSIARSPIS